MVLRPLFNTVFRVERVLQQTKKAKEVDGYTNVHLPTCHKRFHGFRQQDSYYHHHHHQRRHNQPHLTGRKKKRRRRRKKKKKTTTKNKEQTKNKTNKLCKISGFLGLGQAYDLEIAWASVLVLSCVGFTGG